MGYSVLYIAFGAVALWLLGEVLLQYKARLRWRALAFAGFLGVVLGVASHQVAVIVLGALAFGAGQVNVTLSYKRGFAAGWALDLRGHGRPRLRSPHSDPVLEVSAVEEDTGAVAPSTGGADAGDQLAGLGGGPQEVYQPEPAHDDSGEHPRYGSRPYEAADQRPYQAGPYDDGAAAASPAPAADPYAGSYGGYGYDAWGTGQQPAAASYGYDQGQPIGQDPYAQGYGWSADQSGYAPQAAAQPDAAPYGYDPAGYPQQQPAQGYGGGYDSGAYSTGEWTPQPAQPAADPYGYGYGQGQGQDGQGQQPPVPQQQPYDPAAAPYPPYDQQQAKPADPYDPYRY